ncbi:MAG: tRNA (N(6)-L-threonylcarbamoyladenosine(37)-C(2))-methylthiotransferase MtaB [Bacteroidia bacterium]|nr:tRNA (N(6)-L-threonylcarbamoyladenosine(37)-C(2))-methylthiotransferase MtaB [Bacteroidia bacterium]
MKVAFHTLGCKLNFSESSALNRQLEEVGFQSVAFQDTPDVFVVNTCSVTENADKKCRKLVAQAKRINPNALITIIGCYAQLKPAEIAAIPGVNAVLGAADKFRLPQVLQELTATRETLVRNTPIREVNVFEQAWSAGDRTRSFLKVQDGCDYKCTFCTIPLARGKSRSDTIENVLRNAEAIAATGVQEIVLTGVNLGDFGKGTDNDFFDLVQALDAQAAVPRIRISSIEPNLLHDDIIRFVANSRVFMPHFHLPLQSGNNEMLAVMRRRYRRELYASRVEYIRQEIPHASIGVDVITGFPGESEAHFSDTWQFIEDLPVSYLHVFTYSERADTPAAEMANPVPIAVRQERTRRLISLSEKKKLAFYRQFIGQKRPVLFEADQEDGMISGFTDNYLRVQLPWEASLVNSLLPVHLEGLAPNGNLDGQIQLVRDSI